VQYYRFAKSEIWARDNDKKSADQARERHEFREFRTEREKQEKADKLAAKEKAALAAKQATPVNDDAQQKIQAAMAMAKQQAVTPKNVSDLTPQQQAEIADIEARRARAQSDM
jgi:electron transport complex protein RnfC